MRTGLLPIAPLYFGLMANIRTGIVSRPPKDRPSPEQLARQRQNARVRKLAKGLTPEEALELKRLREQ